MASRKKNPALTITWISEICSTIRVGLRCGAMCGIFYIVMAGLKEIALSSPEGISALAKVVEAFKFGTVSAYMLAGGLSIAWVAERNGKKRAIQEKSRYQRLLESTDPHRSSSGLTDTGDTPED